jgi:hypothetical protein
MHYIWNCFFMVKGCHCWILMISYHKCNVQWKISLKVGFLYYHDTGEHWSVWWGLMAKIWHASFVVCFIGHEVYHCLYHVFVCLDLVGKTKTKPQAPESFNFVYLITIMRGKILLFFRIRGQRSRSKHDLVGKPCRQDRDWAVTVFSGSEVKGWGPCIRKKPCVFQGQRSR